MARFGKFVRESFAEFEHVVWPTHNEAKRYFKVVVVTIILSTILLFLLSFIFGKTLFGVREWIESSDASNVTLPTSSAPALQIQEVTTSASSSEVSSETSSVSSASSASLSS